MWTSTLKIDLTRVLATRILGFFWRGAYFSSLAPLQVKNLPRRPLASRNSSQVRVHNRLAGICGSDLHLVFADGDLRIAPAALPSSSHSYPGHEVVGEVIEIGDQVQNLRVGERVVFQHGPNCLTSGIQPPCHSCAIGNYNLCENADHRDSQQIGGGWSEEMLVHEQQLFRIPDEMEDEQAVLLEPTAVAVHAVLRRLPRPGEKVLIVGAGTIGLLTLQVVRALAPQAEVSVLARHDFQGVEAKGMGAAHILFAHDSYETVAKATGAKLYTGAFGNKMLLGGYDVIYDIVGTRQTVHDNLRWTRAGGTVVLVGINLHRLRLDLSPIWHQEVNLVGSMGHGVENWPIGTDQRRSTFAIAADLITHGLLHPENLITHRFALSDFREALQFAADKKRSRAVKVVFDADRLPASSAPNTQTAQTGEMPSLQFAPLDDLFTPVPASKPAPSTGPSHFTMAQSEDFSADFDNTQFVKPKQRRPPSALQFRRTTGDMLAPTEPDIPIEDMLAPTEPDIPAAKQQIGPTNVTNTPPEALEIEEGIENDSASAQQS
jgi:2-desacetyl-2-hydroxyethyl bacteriochlorophyllide A dehydrogenase